MFLVYYVKWEEIMNNRNLYDCKHLLKNFAKKSKQISYSTALLVTFMITGSVGYSAEFSQFNRL